MTVPAQQGRFYKGARVFHRTHGYGTITKIAADEKTAEFTIDFEKGGPQKLKANYLWDVVGEQPPETPPIPAHAKIGRAALEPSTETKKENTMPPALLGKETAMPKVVEFCIYCKEPLTDENTTMGFDEEGPTPCDRCSEDIWELGPAVAKAEGTKDALLAYVAWKQTLRAPKDGFGPRLSPCESCGKLLVISEAHYYAPGSKNKRPNERWCNADCMKAKPEVKA